MYWLDNNTGISTAPTPPAVTSLTKRFFTNGGLGEQPSIPEDFWFNMVQEELLGILTLAGITPDKSDLNQVAKAIQSIAFSAYPVGSPIPWPLAVPPAGFLVLNGQSFSTVNYPKLAAAYPSGALPDLRAEFIRGWDNGRGIDVGRNILSPQAGDNLSHRHFDLFAKGGNAGGTVESGTAFAKAIYGPADPSLFKAPVAGWTGPSAGLTSSDSGSEARPRNIAFNYIVRAA